MSSFKIKSIKSIKNLKNKKILVRCDFDVPLKNRKVEDDFRLKSCIPTIKFLLNKKVKQIILIGHLGRPKGKIVKELSLLPVKNYLEKKLKIELKIKNNELNLSFIDIDRHISKVFVDKIMGDKNKIVMLENLRFNLGENKNNKNFAKKLASLADIYVNEAFAVSHRKVASISAIQNYLPSFVGLHLEQEIKNLSETMSNPKHKLVLIIGGAKIETKLPVIKNFINKADYILIGGAVANNFLLAEGFEIGKSLVDKKYLDISKTIINQTKKSKTKLILPSDVKWSDEKKRKLILKNKKENFNKEFKNLKILDIGLMTIENFSGIIKTARIIVWNGPLGYFEDKKFAKGTKAIAENILKNKKAKIIIGGGETAEAIKNIKYKNIKNIFISTGGGAMLEFLAGKEMPGLKK